MTVMNMNWTNPQKQRGTALIVALVFLLLMTILAVTAVSRSSLEEKMAGNLKDQQIAFQAAEAALRDAENYLGTLNPPKSKFVDACTDGVTPGLCTVAPAASPPRWETVNWANGSTNTAVYGTGTGATALAGPVQQPRYIIEDIPNPPSPTTSASAPSGSLGTGFGLPPPAVGGGDYYRITARGVGGTAAAQAMLQVIYAK